MQGKDSLDIMILALIVAIVMVLYIAIGIRIVWFTL